MIDLTTIEPLIAQYGLLIIAPIALLEGPIITVISAWMAFSGLLDPLALYVVLVLADLAGDLALYGLGRWGAARVAQRVMRLLGLREGHLRLLSRRFHHAGGRTLAFGKLTHAAGGAVLLAAGMGRMALGSFLWINTALTLIKTAFFMGLGYGMGNAYARIDQWISWTSVGVVIAIGLALLWRLRGPRLCR